MLSYFYGEWMYIRKKIGCIIFIGGIYITHKLLCHLNY